MPSFRKEHLISDLDNDIFFKIEPTGKVIIMPNLGATALNSVLVLGLIVSSVKVHPQDHSKEADQPPSQGSVVLAGCYAVALLSWNPPDVDGNLIPKRFELLSVPREPGATVFGIRSLEVLGDRDLFDYFWIWSPKGKDRLEINWGTGWGGFRGSLKRSGSGELVGKIKEYCDSHCAYRRGIGNLRLQKIACPQN